MLLALSDYQPTADFQEKSFSTSGVPVGDKPNYWNNALRQVCGGFKTDFGDPWNFDGRIALREFLGFGAASIQTNCRGAFQDQIAADQAAAGYFFVIVQLNGQAVMAQGGNEARLNPGDYTVIDGRRPCAFHFSSPVSQLSLHIPAEFGLDLFGPDTPFAVTVNGAGGVGRIAVDYIKSAYEQSRHLSDRERQSVRSTLLGLIATSLRAVGEDDGHHLSLGRENKFTRVCQYIRRNLGDPELDLDKIARANGMSRRQVFRLFEERGHSPWRWITKRRLEGARADLGDPAKLEESVTRIAFHWGFKDSAHFSKAFKACYGEPPSVMRAKALKPAHFDKFSAPDDKQAQLAVSRLERKQRAALGIGPNGYLQRKQHKDDLGRS